MTTIHALESGSPRETTKSKAVQAVLRYRRRFAWVFGTGLLLTLLYVFASHKKYESDMSLIVQNARKQEVLSAEATSGGASLVSEVTEEELYSQVELLGSADVLDEVVDPGWRSVPITQHSTAAQKDHEAKVNKLRAKLVIAPVRKSHVIDISYTANDPKVATDTLNRVLQVYLQHEKNVASPPGAGQFFGEAANRYEAQWRQAQAELAQFQQDHHLTSVGDKETSLNQSISDALALQRAAEAEANEYSHKVAVERKQQAATPQRQKTMERVLPAAGSIDQANTLLTQLELRRAQLLTEYLPTDRLVLQVESQIASAKEQLAKSQTMNSVEASSNVNPTWQAQDQQLNEDQAHLNAVSARAAAIGAQVNDLEGQMKLTEQDTLKYNTLQGDVTNLAANYQLYQQKRDAAQVSEAMDARGLINIGIAQSPTFSISPVRPRPLIDSILGLITSFLLACFAVYLAESGRHTIATSAELAGATRYPVLASVSLAEYRATHQTLSSS